MDRWMDRQIRWVVGLFRLDYVRLNRHIDPRGQGVGQVRVNYITFRNTLELQSIPKAQIQQQIKMHIQSQYMSKWFHSNSEVSLEIARFVKNHMLQPDT